MATYEEILNREFTHEYLKKYDDGEDLTKYNTLKKIIELYVERATYFLLMYKYTTINILSTTKIDKLIIVLDDQLALDDVKPYFNKIKEDYFSKLSNKKYFSLRLMKVKNKNDT